LIPPARSLREQSKLNLTVKFSKNKELAMGVATTSAVLDDEVIWASFLARIFKTAAKAGKIYKHNNKYK
jgi:hypothetical protein